MICIKCGAEFGDDTTQCPYCGAVNVEGALKDYDERLDDIKDDLGELADDSLEGYKGGISVTLKIVATVLAVCIALITIVFAVTKAISVKNETDEAAEARARYQWKQVHIPVLDAMYDNGDFEAIEVYISEHGNDPGFDLTYWEHITFMELYNSHDLYQDFSNMLYKSDGSYDMLSVKLLIEHMHDIDRYSDRIRNKLTAQECEMLDQWQAEVRAFYWEGLGMTDEEVDDMYNRICFDDGIGISSSRLNEYVDDRFGGAQE